MLRKFGAFHLACSLLVCIGCSQKLPLEEAGATVQQPDFSHLSTPLDLTSFEVVSSGGGYRGVFLHLSRFPDGITTSDQKNPARIVIDIQGPTSVEEPETAFPGRDSLVSMVRVSKSLGGMRVILDLATPSPPEYSVHRMADFIMVRMKPPATD